MADDKTPNPCDTCTLDRETIALLAKSAADETVNGLRQNLVKEVKEEIEKAFKHHFGEMTPFEHANQHNRVDKLLNSLDKLSENFWGQIIGGLVKWGIAIFVAGYFYMNHKV